MSLYAPLKTELGLSLMRYWDELRGDRLMPLRSEIDLGPIKRALPYLVIYEPRSPTECLFRLVGTAVRDMLGREITGQNLFALSPAEVRRGRSWRFWSAATQPCGHYFHMPVTFPHDMVSMHEGFSLPLRPEQAHAPALLFGLFAPVAGEHWLNRGPITQLNPTQDHGFIDIGAGVPASLEPPPSYPYFD